MPGYGASQALEDAAPTVDDYVAVLIALLDALGETNIHILGQPMAALIAARFAERTLSFVFAHGLTGLGGLPAADAINVTLTIPLTVKKDWFTLPRSSGRTMLCSYIRRSAINAQPPRSWEGVISFFNAIIYIFFFVALKK